MAEWRKFTLSTVDDYKTLNLEPNNISVIIDPKIKTLNVSGVEKKDGFRQFCEGLSQSTTLISLDVSHMRIQLEHCIYLVEALKQNKSITHLNLHGNMIGAVSMIYIKELLNVNQTLRELNLQLNSLGEEGCELICQGLAKNRTLTSLILVNNNLTSKSLIYIGTLLQSNTTLTHLDLSKNKLTEPAGFERSFNKALKINETLRSLELLSTRVTLEDLEEGLTANRSLTELNVVGNYKGSTDLDGIYEILTKSASLTYINLLSIDITPKGYETLADGLRSNSSLTVLRAEIYQNPGYCMEVILDALETNTSLTRVNIDRVSAPSRMPQIIPEFREKLQEVQKMRIGYTKMAMVNIIRSSTACHQFPLEIWQHIFSYVNYNFYGINIDFGKEFQKTVRRMKIERFIKEGFQKLTQAFIDKLFYAATAK